MFSLQKSDNDGTHLDKNSLKITQDEKVFAFFSFAFFASFCLIIDMLRKVSTHHKSFGTLQFQLFYI